MRHRATSATRARARALVVGAPTLARLLQRAQLTELERALASERADVSVADETIARARRDASPAYGDGRPATLQDGPRRMAQLASDDEDSPRAQRFRAALRNSFPDGGGRWLRPNAPERARTTPSRVVRASSETDPPSTISCRP